MLEEKRATRSGGNEWPGVQRAGYKEGKSAGEAVPEDCRGGSGTALGREGGDLQRQFRIPTADGGIRSELSGEQLGTNKLPWPWLPKFSVRSVVLNASAVPSGQHARK